MGATLKIYDTYLAPATDALLDLGTSSVEFKDAYFDGTVTTDGLIVNTVAKSGAYTMTADDSFVACDASGGAFTITLPAAASHTGRVYHIKKIDSSASAVTVDGNGSETIDGGLTALIATQYECISIISNGTVWWVI